MENKKESPAKQGWITLATMLFLACAVYQAIYLRPLSDAAGLDAPGEEFSSARAMEHLRHLARVPRPTGSRDNEDAGAYIRQQIEALGLVPDVQETTLNYQQRGEYLSTRVRNILARKQGHTSTKSVLLVGHYDTVIMSPGAGDDGAAVACLLESLRALQSMPQPLNDVIFLFTDGEELGLVGARAFVAQHPWAKDVGAVLNFEARGSAGPSTLFESMNGNGWLISRFVRAAPHTYGNSLLPSFYKLLPHDTDLSAFKETGVPGLNFAFAEKWSHYHSRLDSVETIDERSIQHHGEYAVGLIRQLANLDLSRPPRGNAVFFNPIGGVLVWYPDSWALPLTVLAALCFVVAMIVGFRKRRLSVLGLLQGFITLPIAIILSAFFAWFFFRIANQLVEEGPAFYESGFYYAGVACIALAVTTFLYAWLSRKAGVENMHQGALLWWLALTIVTALLYRGASFLFVWPLMAGAVMSLLLFLKPLDRRAGLGEVAILWVTALLTLFLLVPVIHQLLIATAGPMGLVVVALVALGTGLLLPMSRLISLRRPAWPVLLGWPALMAASAIVLLTIAVLSARRGPEYPKEDQIFYVANLDQHQAIWATFERKEDGWTSQFFANQGSVIELSKFIPDYTYPKARIFQAAAPLVELAPPTVDVLEDRASDGIRHLTLLIRSPRRSPEVSLFVESEAKVVAANLDGKPLPDAWAQAVTVKDSPDNAAAKLSEPQLRVRCYGLATEGATLLLETEVRARVKLHIVERSYNLPTIDAPGLRPRSAEFTEARTFGDGIIAYRSFTF